MKLVLCFPVLLLALVGCGGRTAMEEVTGEECIDGPCDGSGTTVASGGRSGSSSGKSTKASGGSSSSSKSSSGGKSAKGGDGGTPPSSAGQSSSGGKSVKGGSGGTSVASAGQSGTAGMYGIGGTSTGGISAGGGTKGMAGSTAMISFSNGRGNGVVDGWAWVALGSKDSLGSPTCLGQPITSAAPCMTATTWASPTNLCIQGMIPALPVAPSASDYDTNWGIMVSVESHDPPAPLGASFAALLPMVSGSPTVGLRAIVHRWGDAESVNYCAFFTPAQVITRDKGHPLYVLQFRLLGWFGSPVDAG